MKPKPFDSLNHYTVPLATLVNLLRYKLKSQDDPPPAKKAAKLKVFAASSVTKTPETSK
jgi:hypothetical protein